MAAPMVITPLKVTDIKKQCLLCSSTQKRLLRLDNPKSVQNGYIQSIKNALNVELPSWHFFVCSSCVHKCQEVVAMKETFSYVIKKSEESGTGVRTKSCVADNIIRFVEKLKISKQESEEKVTRTKLRKKSEFYTGNEHSYSVRRTSQGIYFIFKLSLRIKMPYTRYCSYVGI